MRKMTRWLSALLVPLFLLCGFPAAALSYSGSASYASGRYYTALQGVTLTGDPRADIVAVALSQVGYQEGDSSSQLSGEVQGSSNYTEYGRWYGLQDMWCAMFVSWCADTAEIATSVVPRHSFTVSGLNTFIGWNRAYTRAQVAAGTYTPQAGDIIYFKSARNTNKTNHVGIVTGYAGGTVSTVEGNTSSATISTNGGAVCTKSYDIGNTYIVYICSPAYGDTQPENPPAGNVGYFPACGAGYSSLADALASVGADGSYASRKRIAAANGIDGYSGTAAQNMQLLDLLKAGKLIDPDAEPADNGCFPACDASYTTLAAALTSVGADASYSYRAQIAAANGIENYSGTVDQNTAMLSLLKEGALRRPDAASVPTVTYFTACDSGYASLVDALRSIGADSSLTYRKRIAAANGIDDYTGTAAQNTQMLNLLKAGTLIVPTDTAEKSPCGCDAQYAEHILMPATCTEDGAEYDRCTRCGTVFNRTVQSAAGHAYACTHTDASCTACGTDVYVCACGAAYTETIAALGHDFDEAVPDNVTTVQGVRTVRCTRCAQTTTVTAGDLDGDGVLTLKDAILLQRYLADWDVTISEPRADVNRDGAANLMDVTLLLRYMVGGWNVTLL